MPRYILPACAKQHGLAWVHTSCLSVAVWPARIALVPSLALVFIRAHTWVAYKSGLSVSSGSRGAIAGDCNSSSVCRDCMAAAGRVSPLFAERLEGSVSKLAPP